MSDPFLDIESSVQDAEPRELVEIRVNPPTGTVYRHTSATRDISYGGNLFTAIPIERSQLEVQTPGSERDLILSLPIDHALARRYTQHAIPPNTIRVTVYRQLDALTEVIWTGDVTSMAAEGGTAKFRVPSLAGEWMLRALPPLTVGIQCPYVLYGSRCGVSRTGSSPSGIPHKQTTTVLYVNGREARVNLPGVTASDLYRSTWAVNGEFVHVASGETRTIAAQVDLDPGVSTVANLSLTLLIPELRVGHTVEVYRGCDWSIAACNAVFANRQRFGGFNMKPDIDLFSPLGDGVKGAV